MLMKHLRFGAFAVGIATVVSLAVSLDSPPAQASTACASGLSADPTSWSADPRPISSKAELIYLSEKANTGTAQEKASYLNANYVLTTNINLESCLWDPIGTSSSTGSPENSPANNVFFAGSFDGGGFTISGLSISSSEEYLGLFGTLYYVSASPQVVATVKNLQIEGSVVASGGNPVGDYVGSVVGYLNSNALVENVHASVSVSVPNGFSNNVGGLVGRMTDSEITESSATGNVSVRSGNVGGLLGNADNSAGSISHSFATGAVALSISSDGDGTAGGLVGSLTASIENVYATGTVTTTREGGVSSSNSPAGGLIGATVSTPTVSNVFAAGEVDGFSPIGGLIGNADSNPTVTDGFWDSQTTGLPTSAGSLGTAKTTAQMTSFATFTTALPIVQGWQAFAEPNTIWGICSSVNSGYPFLLWEYSSNPCSVAGSSELEVGTSGIYLNIRKQAGGNVAGTAVGFGAYLIAPNAPYVLSIQGVSVRSPQQNLAQGAVNPWGHLEREITLGALPEGSHKLVLVSRGSGGEVLTLTNLIAVDTEGRFVSITPEAMQPTVR